MDIESIGHEIGAKAQGHSQRGVRGGISPPPRIWGSIVITFAYISNKDSESNSVICKSCNIISCYYNLHVFAFSFEHKIDQTEEQLELNFVV